MKKRLLAVATLVLTIAIAVVATSAFGGGGRFQLYLVNAGPSSSFYNDSVSADGNCDRGDLQSSLSTHPGTGIRQDSVGYLPDGHGPSTFSYTVPAGGAFTIKADSDTIMLKLWAFSGDGTCDGANTITQIISWSLDCNGPTCGSVNLSGGGYQDLAIAAGTPINTLQNVHFGVSSPVKVGVGDTLSLKFTSNYYAPIQWNAANGAGVSVLSILTS
jgi:hypothetical protein